MKEQPMPQIAETLQRLNDANLLSAKQLARLLKLHESSAYRYLSGETEPSWSQVCTVFQYCCRPQVQAAILTDLLGDTSWVCQQMPGDLDVNGDGQVNTHDILDATIHALRGAADALESCRATQKSGFTAMEPPDALVLSQHLQLVIRKAFAAHRVVQFLSERSARAAQRATA
jgi:hypothetical protein